MKGVLSEYANPDLTGREKGTWERAAVEKYADSYNEETRKAIEDARNGIGLTEAYHSASELFAALDAEEEE